MLLATIFIEITVRSHAIVINSTEKALTYLAQSFFHENILQNVSAKITGRMLALSYPILTQVSEGSLGLMCKDLFILNACMYVCMHVNAWVHVCAIMCVQCRGQKEVSDPVKLEIQVVVSCHTGAGHQTQVICKSSKCC